MARSTHIRLVDLATGASDTFRRDGEPAPGAASDETVALVPADRCSVARVDLPEMGAGRLQQALRWAVEDAIAGDPEQQHVVPIEREQDGRLACLVVARADMERWLAALDARPDRMLPDAACLPWSPGEVVLMQAGEAVLARAASTTFDRIEPDVLEDLVPDLCADAGADADVVWLGAGSPPPSLGKIKTRAAAGRALDVLAPAAVRSDASRLDLLRGEYGARDRAASTRQWRVLVATALLAVLLLLAGTGAEIVMLERERTRLVDAVRARVDSLFPELGPLVRPRAQVERALARRAGGGSDRFVRLLAAVGPVFGGADGVTVQALDYADGMLDLTLETPALADLEALQRQLGAAGLRVALRDVEVGDRIARGRLRIEGAR